MNDTSMTAPGLGRWRSKPTAGGRFEGADVDGPVSGFVVAAAAGEGPDPHRHPYAETFVVLEGGARFIVDGAQFDLADGDIAVVPAGAVHAFVAASGGLRMIAIHHAPRIEQAFDPAAA